jgi:hypothetical protein
VWAVPGRIFQSLLVPCAAGDKQGRAGQPLWGVARGAISIKEILGENQGYLNKYIKIEKNEDRQNKNRKNKNMKQT